MYIPLPLVILIPCLLVGVAIVAASAVRVARKAKISEVETLRAAKQILAQNYQLRDLAKAAIASAEKAVALQKTSKK